MSQDLEVSRKSAFTLVGVSSRSRSRQQYKRGHSSSHKLPGDWCDAHNKTSLVNTTVCFHARLQTSTKRNKKPLLSSLEARYCHGSDHCTEASDAPFTRHAQRRGGGRKPDPHGAPESTRRLGLRLGLFARVYRRVLGLDRGGLGRSGLFSGHENTHRRGHDYGATGGEEEVREGGGKGASTHICM